MSSLERVLKSQIAADKWKIEKRNMAGGKGQKISKWNQLENCSHTDFGVTD